MRLEGGESCTALEGEERERGAIGGFATVSRNGATRLVGGGWSRERKIGEQERMRRGGMNSHLWPPGLPRAEQARKKRKEEREEENMSKIIQKKDK